MINLRYHIVSLTAVFLAIGIGLTLGSTFLDRATVDNLNGQLDNLQTRLEDRETRINELEDELDVDADLTESLDQSGLGLLSGRLPDTPVVVVAARGAAEDDVEGSVASLVIADADVLGTWWLTERWALDDEEEVTALATVLDEDSSDPSRLRRMAVDALGGELRVRQLRSVEAEDDADVDDDVSVGDDEEDGATTTAPDAGDEPAVSGAESGRSDLVDALVEAGFIDFEAVSGGPDSPRFPDGTRVVFGAGSPDVPDDVVLEPLVARMTRNTDVPLLGVVGSAIDRDDRPTALADAVTVIRQDEDLVELVATVDELDHFQGWAAMVLALADAGEGVVGHYGLDESASGLLPPPGNP